jgi:hypothetical protein
MAQTESRPRRLFVGWRCRRRTRRALSSRSAEAARATNCNRLAEPRRIDEDHVAFGYRFSCLTPRRHP